MPKSDKISDKGLAIFAFAIYHQLESGKRVTQIVRNDGAGHKADPAGVDELRQLGVLDIDGDRVSFTAHGEAMIDSMLGGMRRALASDEKHNEAE